MKTEFKLSEKRKELREDCQGFSVSSIMDLVEQQDKEFIKRLKEEIEWCHTDKLGMITRESINKLAGEKLK